MTASYDTVSFQRYKKLRGIKLLEAFLGEDDYQDIALVSSFGAESAVLLHMASNISKDVPVIFLETGKLFKETLAYKQTLVTFLGLTNVHTAPPADQDLKQHDPQGNLWQSKPNRCCEIRKTIPLKKVLEPYKGWITGRKRYQSPARANLPAIEFVDGKIKINPLVDFTLEEVKAYLTKHNLPQHPLVARGYPSIGCETCTMRPINSSDPRSGRWAHNPEKTECGIHFSDGKVVRSKVTC